MTRQIDTRRVALVVASTYPRWHGDFEPGFVHELAKRMVATFRVIVLTPSSPGAASRECMDGVEVIRYRYAPQSMETLVYGGGITSHLRRSPWKCLLLPTFLMAQIFTLIRATVAHRPSIIHAHWAIPQGALATLVRVLGRQRIPLLVTAHGSDVFGLRGGFFRAIRAWVGRHIDTWTVVGDLLADKLVEEGAARTRESVAVMPMGVDLSSTFARSDHRRDTDMILFVGRLVPGKGVDVLLDAMVQVAVAVPTARLEIAGDGPLRISLESRAIELGISSHIKFHGALGNHLLPELYRVAAVTAAPFTSVQGFGLTIVEALGCGCPVVTTSLGSAREMARDVSLIQFVEPGDSSGLAQSLICALRDPPNEVRTEASVAYVRERYDWNTVALSYVRLYERLGLPSNGNEHATPR